MSFLRALYAGVSGLTNTQTMMDVIGNNISNINTVGFKASRATFSDTFSQLLSNATQAYPGSGGTNAIQVGLGMAVSSVDTLFSQGNIQTTNSATDLAIDGSAFFVVNKGGTNFYTRAGGFTFDSTGTLVSSSGAIVQGKLADAAGNIPSGTTLQDIKISFDQKSPAKATTDVTLSGNLSPSANFANIALSGDIDSNSLVGDVVSKTVTMTDNFGGTEDVTVTLTKSAANTYDVATSATNGTVNGGTGTATFDPTTGALTSFTPPEFTLTPANGAPTMTVDFNSTQLLEAASSSLAATLNSPSSTDAALTVYDSLGNPHVVTLTMTRTASNTWTWAANTASGDASTITSGRSGTIAFGSDGTLQAMTFDDGSTGLSINPNNGAAAMTVNLNAGSAGSLTGITQDAGDSSVTQSAQNGYAAGAMSSIAIDETGKVNATFSNGIIMSLGQVLVANFNNPSGLIKEGDGLYITSGNSGEASIAEAGTTSTIKSDSLEQSNVDLSTEFTDMITAQRGFQANARVITTCDNILEEVVNMKR